MKALFHSRRRVALLFLFAAALGVLVVFLMIQRSSRLEILSVPPPPQKSRLAFLGRWMWPVKLRVARIRQMILGRPRVVQLDSTIAEFAPGTKFDEFEVINAVTNESGDAVMVVTCDAWTRDLIAARPRARLVSRQKVITVDGVEAQMSVTHRSAFSGRSNAPMLEAGSWLRVRPRVRSDGLDLTCFLVHSEIERRPERGPNAEVVSEPFVRTNLAFGAHARVPAGAFLLLVGAATNSDGRILGILVSPASQPKK